VVLDPFAGSGTTLAVAKKLGRRWLGFELSEKYAKKATERLDRVHEGQPLAGAPEPLVSAPQTPKTNGRAKKSVSPELPLFHQRRPVAAAQAEGLTHRSRGQRPRNR
jgi:site-specific DNA-methyltransferase (adenine-specific)